MTRTFLVLFAVLLLAVPLAYADLAGWHFVAIDEGSQAAVVKNPAGELSLVKVGDPVGEARLTGFDGDHAVLEATGEWDVVTLIVSVEAGEQQVARIERRPLPATQFLRGEVKSYHATTE